MRVINWAPTIDLVDLVRGLRRIHDEIAREVVRPDKPVGVAKVPVHVQREEEGEVAVVSVDGGDEEVVALSRGDTQLVCLGLGDVCTVVHDDLHGMGVDVEHGSGEGRKADEANAVRLALNERNLGTGTIVDDDAVRERRQELRGVAGHLHVLDELNGLRMIPVGHGEDDFLVVLALVGILRIVHDECSAEAIGVLSLPRTSA